MSEVVIQITDLQKTYDNGFEAVKGITLNIPRGIVYGFLGPNGAGKTTSLKMMVGLLKPSNGQVTINGHIPEQHSQEIKKLIGLIPQDLVLWEDLTVYENLHFVASMYRIPKNVANEKIDTLIKEIKLEEKRNSLAKHLSGGLKRRLNIIMGLVHDPQIVVCDEPTPGLDAQSRGLVWDFIMNLTRKQGKTVILTTHFMEEADRLSDIISIIDNGKVLITDTGENLKNSIGEGDLVEIHLNNSAFLNSSLDLIKTMDGVEDVFIHNDTLQVRCLNAPSKLAVIFNKLESQEGLEVRDLKIRKTTLEDVFLNLTGRDLRE
ncbi:MAG: ABC transporter ATP-binding protein [Candidatus Heimdallarchaeota archaeon]|nr:ABC transporter ATP-binding protein [Candidatus Heimdallarchaeota archaeon]MDH5646412.1 ABC transporter ATP-binding protein [Candidatus Heimdallarchaeota archaeon]